MSFDDYFIFDTQTDDKNQLRHYLIEEIALRLISKLEYANYSIGSVMLDGFWSEKAIQLLITKFALNEIFYRIPQTAKLPKKLDRVHFVSSLNEQDHKIDLVLSNLYLHHFEDNLSYLTKLKSILSNQGCLFFSSIGPMTLFPETYKIKRPANWLDMHDIGDHLRKIGYKDPVMDQELLAFIYDSYSRFNADLSSIGKLLAIEALDNAFKADIYKTIKESNESKMPIEIIYGHAWQQLTNKQSNNEVYISLDQLGLSKKNK